MVEKPVGLLLFRSGLLMPDTIIPNPANGLNHYGFIKQKKVGKIVIPAGPIFLKRGKQSGHGGFGAKHIWFRHEKEIRARGYSSLEDVPKYVADIIKPGSPVFCEFATMADIRVTVIRTQTGAAVLEYKDFDENHHYSVVTAFLPRNAHGTRIGSVAEFEEI